MAVSHFYHRFYHLLSAFSGPDISAVHGLVFASSEEFFKRYKITLSGSAFMLLGKI